MWYWSTSHTGVMEKSATLHIGATFMYCKKCTQSNKENCSVLFINFETGTLDDINPPSRSNNIFWVSLPVYRFINNFNVHELNTLFTQKVNKKALRIAVEVVYGHQCSNDHRTENIVVKDHETRVFISQCNVDNNCMRNVLDVANKRDKLLLTTLLV